MKVRVGFVSNSSSASFYINSSMHTKEEVRSAIYDMNAETGFQISQSTNEEVAKIISESGYFGDASIDSIKSRLPYNCIVVDSTRDNSIPYEVQEMLEYKFDALRQHWG